MAIRRTRPFRKPPKHIKNRKNTSIKSSPLTNQYNKVETFTSEKGNYIKNRDNIRLLSPREIQLYCPDVDCRGSRIINCPGDNQTCCCDDQVSPNPGNEIQMGGCYQPGGIFGTYGTGCPPNYMPTYRRVWTGDEPGMGYQYEVCVCSPMTNEPIHHRDR